MKAWLKQFLALCISVFIILSSVSQVYADDYVKSGNDDEQEYTYYIVDGKDVSDLFDFTVYDLGKEGGTKIVSWAFTFKTFTVLKKYSDQKTGETLYKGYFNTPNLQSIIKNEVIRKITDGYTNNTYNINNTQFIVKVGKDGLHKNAITQYGFAIPSYTYIGEYPKETMSIAGIVPDTFFKGVWKAIKSAFTGASFLDAPDTENFNTITYMNHTYTDESDFTTKAIEKYYLDYFVRRIDGNSGTGTFNGASDIISQTITAEAAEKAAAYMNLHEDEYEEAKKKMKLYEDYKDKCGVEDTLPLNDIKIKLNGFFAPTSLKDSFIDGLTLGIRGYLRAKDCSDIIENSAGLKSNFKEWANRNKSFVKDVLGKEPDLSDANIYATIREFESKIDNPSAKKYVKDANGKDTKTIDKIQYTDKNKWWDVNQYTKYFTDHIAICTYDFKEEDFIDADSKAIYDEYLKQKKIYEDYEAFIKKFNGGKKIDIKDIKAGKLPTFYYNQCMIKKNVKAKKNECWNKIGKDKVTLCLADVYAYSGLYKITENYDDTDHKITSQDAHKVIQKLQSYCGPYYTEVLSNIMVLMSYCAMAEGNTKFFELMDYTDPRVMPYDTTTMVLADKENYAIKDPRVEIYKGHFIGEMVSDFTLSSNWNFFIFIKPQEQIISFCGRLTELSIFMQELCNFDRLDSMGLSPTYMWSSGWVVLIMALLTLFFIIKTVSSILKMGTNAGGRLAVGFLVLLLELGLITAIAADPEGTWTKLKTMITTVSNLGEMMGPANNNPDLDYLYEGANDQEILYYLPYMDAWSKYNTGYGIFADQQKIDTSSDVPELKDFENPQLNGKDINHYSVLLMDSFSYYGGSNSAVTSVLSGNKKVNGPTINNNAYRVVDHFLAPRVTIKEKDTDRLTLSVKENENYNGEFQSGFMDVICKLLNCCLGCFLSLLKLLTFIWFWFKLYIFVFNAMLGKLAYHKKWSDILLETFGPLLALIFLGMYNSIVLNIGMHLEGLLGCVIIVGFFFITGLVVLWWHDISRGLIFPGTLKWLYHLISHLVKGVNRREEADMNSMNKANSAYTSDIEFDSSKSLDEQSDQLFESDDSLKQLRDEDLRYAVTWRQNVRRAERRGEQISDTVRRRAAEYDKINQTTDKFVNARSKLLKEMSNPSAQTKRDFKQDDQDRDKYKAQQNKNDAEYNSQVDKQQKAKEKEEKTSKKDE